MPKDSITSPSPLGINNSTAAAAHSYGWANSPIAVYSENAMPPTNAEYQLSYYQPLSYGMDVTGGHGTWTTTPSAGHIGGGGGYPPPTHTTSTLYAAPLNDLYRHHPPPPPPPPPPSHNGTTSYGVQPDYTSVFDYARAWQPSVMTHGPEPTKSSMQQHHDYYRNSGYATSASNDDHHHQHAQQHYRDLNHHMSHLTVSPSSVPAAVGHHPHQGFGPVTGGGAQQPTSAPPPPPPPPPNKPLTWADKVKQVPKDATNSYKSKKIPIGGIAGAAQRKPPPPPPSSNLSPSTLLPPPPPAPPTTTSPQWISPTVAVATRPSWNSGDRVLTNGAVESLPTAISRNGGGSDRTTKTTPTPVVKSDNDENDDDTSSEDTVARLKRETNPSELSMTVKGARFFVIKSYSEDDVHRSIKYGIWCSTEHGNKRLDAAFRERDRHGGGPIYLLFSVNASGHFCGIAQMMSAVDYDTQSGVWAQDKWKGLFRVRWLYVKDVPNQQLRSIRLENNENKPVTNSRDTQEVPHEKGRQVIRIVHEFRHTTSLFDDFSHYEQRQRESVAAGGGGGGGSRA